MRSSMYQDLSLWRRLPEELLVEIFLSGYNSHLVESHRKRGPYRISKDDTYICNLSSVCSLWRELIISTPRLWSNVVWYYYSPLFDTRDSSELVTSGTRSFESRMARLSMYLERSNQAPLDLSVTLHHESTEEAGRVHALLLPHLQRCCSFGLVVYPHLRVDDFFPLPGQMARLKNLTIVALENSSSVSNLCLFEPISQSPLWRLEITSSTPLGPQVLENVPPHHLSSIRLFLHPSNLGIALDFLRRCTTLTVLDLRFTASPAYEMMALITLPELRELHIRDTKTFNFAFRRAIHTPKLEELSIELYFPKREAPPPQLTLTSSYLTLPSLQKFSVTYLSEDGFSSFTKFCTVNSSITTLDVSGWWFHIPRLLQATEEVQETSSRTAILPHLQTLQLRRSFRVISDHKIFSELQEVLRSRPHMIIQVASREFSGNDRDDLKNEFGNRVIDL